MKVVDAYDAGYAVLAQALGCPLVTADRRLARALHTTVPVETV
jgi:predicted nucleic acid-binding protein